MQPAGLQGVETSGFDMIGNRITVDALRTTLAHPDPESAMYTAVRLDA